MKRFFLFLLLGVFLPLFSQETTAVLPVRKDKVEQLKQFVKGSKYNQDLAMFIDFKIHSGKFRFFVYDLKKDKVLAEGIVSHGSGSVIPNSNSLKFSNVENSYQSSLGKYEILGSYVGTFGKSYRLKGLDKTNSLAQKRAIVLHALDCVPDQERTALSCLSLGCPMLSPKFFTKTAQYIDQSAKPIILYAYY